MVSLPARLVLGAAVLDTLTVRLCHQMGWSVEGRMRVQRHASAHVPQISALLSQHPSVAHPAILKAVCDPL